MESEHFEIVASADVWDRKKEKYIKSYSVFYKPDNVQISEIYVTDRLEFTFHPNMNWNLQIFNELADLIKTSNLK